MCMILVCFQLSTLRSVNIIIRVIGQATDTYAIQVWSEFLQHLLVNV